MLQLRVTKMNNQWNDVTKLVQTEFKSLHEQNVILKYTRESWRFFI